MNDRLIFFTEAYLYNHNKRHPSFSFVFIPLKPHLWKTRSLENDHFAFVRYHLQEMFLICAYLKKYNMGRKQKLH